MPVRELPLHQVSCKGLVRDEKTSVVTLFRAMTIEPPRSRAFWLGIPSGQPGCSVFR